MAAIPMVIINPDELEALIERAVEKAFERGNEQGVTISETATRLGLSIRTVERRIKDGTLPAVKIGGSVRIPLSAVLPRAG
jgi:excisionase family DNA binding protein